MKSSMKLMLVLALVCVFVNPLSTYAGDAGIKIGALVVKAVEGSRKNLIIRSSVDVVAEFTDLDGNKEYYIGEMGQKFGIDMSIKKKEVLRYAVFSPSSAYKTGLYALAGKYFGAKASVAAGAGVGAQVLLGGFDKSFTLQPLSAGGVKGVGASLGLGYLYLQRDTSK
jgi:hypothetical protein